MKCSMISKPNLHGPNPVFEFENLFIQHPYLTLLLFRYPNEFPDSKPGLSTNSPTYQSPVTDYQIYQSPPLPDLPITNYQSPVTDYQFTNFQFPITTQPVTGYKLFDISIWIG